MHLGIFAKTFPRPTLEETLDAVVARGLTHIQFNMSCLGLATLPDGLDESSCVWIARSLAERGLTMAAISGTFNMCDPSDSRLQNNLRRLEVLAAACRWLDTRIITLCTGTLDPKDMWRWNRGNVRRSTWQSLVQTMREAVKIADRHEVTLAFEPEINNVVNSVSKARMLLDEVGSPWLKVVIDPANLFHSGNRGPIGETVDEALEWLGPDIVLAHAKEPRIEYKGDATFLNPIDDEMFHRFALAGSRTMSKGTLGRPPAEGTAESSEWLLRMHIFYFYYVYLWRLKEMSYTGAVVVHGLEESEVERTVSFLREILDFSLPEHRRVD